MGKNEAQEKKAIWIDRPERRSTRSIPPAGMNRARGAPFLEINTMADINRVTIIGRLTKDAEVTYTPGGMAIASLSLAINRSTKGQDGKWYDEANYFDVKVFGKQADSLKPYLTKGKQIGVDGYLKQERWEKDGQKKSRVIINANDIQLLGGKDKAQDQNSGYDDYTY